MNPSRKRQSALVFILKGLIPYSRENLILSFRPNQFFNELEKISKYKEGTLRTAYWRAQNQGLIEQYKNLPRLTKAGQNKIKPFFAEQLKGKAQLMVIFDIPENQAKARRKLRETLREWRFKQVQKSVWATDKDYRTELVDVIDELKLHDCVEIYECVRQFPK